MPIPTNITALLATDLGTLPASVTQTVDNAGTTYTVWYKFTAPALSRVIGAWPFGDLTVYKPAVECYVGPASAPVSILGISGGFNKAIQFPITAGVEYFLKISPNSGNPTPASLQLEVEVAPLETIAAGDIIINDSSPGFPLAVLSPTTNYTVKNFVNVFPAGEAGDIIHDSPVALLFADETSLYQFYLYDQDFVELAIIPFMTAFEIAYVRANQTTKQFYIANGGSGVTPAKFRTVSPLGVLGTVVTLPYNDLQSLAPNIDDTILYFSGAAGSGDTIVRRWDIINGVELATFLPDVADYKICDIIVMRDDTVLISYEGLVSETGKVNVKRYDASGTLLNTYDFGTTNAALAPRMATALDDPTTFWIMTHQINIANGISYFKKIQVSDGTVLLNIEQAEYNFGVYQRAVSNPPLARFGNSNSCPMAIMNLAAAPAVNQILRMTADLRTDNSEIIPSPFFITSLLGE